MSSDSERIEALEQQVAELTVQCAKQHLISAHLFVLISNGLRMGNELGMASIKMQHEDKDKIGQIFEDLGAMASPLRDTINITEDELRKLIWDDDNE